MTNKLLFLSIALLTMQQSLNAQTVQPIAKSEVMSRLAKNASVNIAEQEFKQTKAEYRQTNAVFLPTVTRKSYCFFYYKSFDGFWI